MTMGLPVDRDGYDLRFTTNTPRPGETPEQTAARVYRERPAVRTFASGATRDTDENKLDFEGFLSPLVLEEFAKYMHAKRKMPDGSLRDSDNWQKGIPTDAYMKSMWRHFFAVWKSYGAGNVSREDLLALLFNVQGMTHEILRKPEWPAPGCMDEVIYANQSN